MIVKDLVNKLLTFSQDLEVKIADEKDNCSVKISDIRVEPHWLNEELEEVVIYSNMTGT